MVIMEKKNRKMTEALGIIVRTPHGYVKVAAQFLCSARKMARILSRHHATISQRLHHDHAACSRLAMCQYLSQLVSLSHVVFCFTCLKCHINKKRVVVHVWYTNAQNTGRSHSHHTISARPPYGSCTGAVRYPSNFYVLLVRLLNDRTISL